MATQRVRIEGLKELDKALGGLPKATGKAALRRVLKEQAQPLADAIQAGAPHLTGTLQESVGVSTKLSKRQRRQHRKMFRSDRASVEMFVGAGPLAQAHAQEFGTEHHPPQAFARPAWDAHKLSLLDGIKENLWAEIEKATQRLARKRARQARG